jgi:hypothetical protein
VKQIVWTAQAIAEVRSIDQPVALQILKTLARTQAPARAIRTNFKASTRR